MRVTAILFFFVLGVLPHVLAARWALSSFPALRARRRGVWGVALGLSLVPTAGRLSLWLWPSSPFVSFAAVAMVEVFALWLAVIPVVIASVLARLLPKKKETPPPAEGSSHDIGRREAIERVVGIGAFGAASVTLGWGAVRGRHQFVVEEVVVRIPGLPRVLDGYVIAQVSDIHVGAFVGDRELDEGFDAVKRLRPDLVVATGDLVDFISSNASPLAARLAAVGARDGAFAILGNHDHYAGPADVAALVRAAGVTLLSNEGVHVREGDGGGFALLGVDDLQGRRLPNGSFRGPDLARAIAQVRPDRPRILLAHQPTFLKESSGRVALQLSGHTHGGQINPGVQPAKLLMPYVEGRYERDGTSLWVNRGFGVVGPPSRVGAPPEVTKIVLVAG